MSLYGQTSEAAPPRGAPPQDARRRAAIGALNVAMRRQLIERKAEAGSLRQGLRQRRRAARRELEHDAGGPEASVPASHALV